MQIIDTPRTVDRLVGAMAADPNGEIGVVVVSRIDENRHLLLLDALYGSFSAFSDFVEAAMDAVDELGAATISANLPVLFVDVALYERAGRHRRFHAPHLGIAMGTQPKNVGCEVAFYPPRAEADPAYRAMSLAAGAELLRATPAMAAKALNHPFDALAAGVYDQTKPSVLADALSRAFDLTMIDGRERIAARHRRGLA
jgi:hypothetical protein